MTSSKKYCRSILIVPDLGGVRSGKLKSGAAPGVLRMKPLGSADAAPSNAVHFHEHRQHHQTGEVARANQAYPEGVRSRVGSSQVNASPKLLGRMRIFEQKPEERLTPAGNEIVSFRSSIDRKTM